MIATALRRRPTIGPLFPYLRSVRSSDRATEFKQRCEGLGIKGVTLHSYRYAWAERARKCGYPERLAQGALRHNSKAVHRSYARRAQVTLPSLEKYERAAHVDNICNLEAGRVALRQANNVAVKPGQMLGAPREHGLPRPVTEAQQRIWPGFTATRPGGGSFGLGLRCSLLTDPLRDMLVAYASAQPKISLRIHARISATKH
jgi:hypothetical protein